MIRSRFTKLSSSVIDDIINSQRIATITNQIIDKNINNNLNVSKSEIVDSSSTELEQHKQHDDQFTENFLKNRIQISTVQKYILGFGSSLAALIDPHRHDMIACLGETTGTNALEHVLEMMKNDYEGQQILADKPRINTNTIDIDSLRKLPENTFGRAYVKFLDDNKVTPDSRMEVKFMDDPELAYVMTRYRECHDLVHTILGMPTHMLGEVAVKWVEALNIGLPMCYGGGVFGAIRLRPKQRKLYTSQYLPWAIKNGKNIKPLMLVYWEKRWAQDITDLRKELNITTLEIQK